MLRQVVCVHCGKYCLKETGHINRANKLKAQMFCSRICAGLSKRNIKPVTVKQKKELKAEYDKQYRIINRDYLRKMKADYYQRTRDPEKERIKRQKNMQKHIAYCRNPEYVKKKAAYDKRKRFQAYGSFEEAARLLEDLEQEIKKRATRYEIYVANGRFTRAATQRRRELWQLMNKN